MNLISHQLDYRMIGTGTFQVLGQVLLNEGGFSMTEPLSCVPGLARPHYLTETQELEMKSG